MNDNLLDRSRFRYKSERLQQFYRHVELARSWWDTLPDTDRDRVLASRAGFLPGDLAESMASAGIPVLRDDAWPCVSFGPAGLRVPTAVEAMLDQVLAA